MATVAVTAHNTRVNAADAVTNWGNDGGGGAIANEVDITYQNNIAQSRKISTTVIGRDYTHGAGTDMTATDRTTYLAKFTVTNPSVLLARSSPALHMKIGSGSTAHHWYYLFGNDNYPPRGGWILLPIDVNVTGYQAIADTGSPNDASILYWSILGDFSVGSKGENVAIDAIDVGAGLNLVGGDGVSTDGVFADFVAFDEGTVANRYGYVFTQEGITFVNGRLAIGQNNSDTSILTVFQDTGSVVVWNNTLAATGYARLLLDIATTSTDIDLIGCTLISRGEEDNSFGGIYTTTEDTRTVLEVTGTSGTADLTSCVLQNFANIILTSVVTLDGCNVETKAFTQASGNIENCIIHTTADTNVATLDDPTFGATTDLNNTEFIQGGAGHAIEVLATATLTGLTFTGYGGTPGSNLVASTGAADAAIFNDTGGAVTLTIAGGGNTPSIRNGAGATTTVINNTQITLTGLVNPTEVRVYEDGTTTEIDGQENVTTGSFAFSAAASAVVDIRIFATSYLPADLVGYVVPSTDTSLPIQQVFDRFYKNP